MNSRPMRVLHILRSLKPGGIGAFVMNMYRKADPEVLQFDFAVAEEDEGVFGPEIKSRGGNIYYLSKSGNRTVFDGIVQMVSLYGILSRHPEITAVHSHYYFANAFFLNVARLAGVGVRVSHCHNFRVNENVGPGREFFESVCRKILEKTATHLLGCSHEATVFLYGKKNFHKGIAKTVYNGIDLDAWERPITREEDGQRPFRIPPGLNFLFVGRYEEQKNPIFLVRVFREIRKRLPNAHLTMVGYGSLTERILKEIRLGGLEEAVTMHPGDVAIPGVMRGADFFLLPSLFEGLPIVLLEAQAMELRCFVSASVSKEIDAGLCHFLGLEKGESFWADEIFKIVQTRPDALPGLNQASLQRFNVMTTLRRMQEIYQGGDGFKEKEIPGEP